MPYWGWSDGRSMKQKWLSRRLWLKWTKAGESCHFVEIENEKPWGPWPSQQTRIQKSSGLAALKEIMEWADAPEKWISPSEDKEDKILMNPVDELRENNKSKSTFTSSVDVQLNSKRKGWRARDKLPYGKTPPSRKEKSNGFTNLEPISLQEQ